jgi:hypothetical protein
VGGDRSEELVAMIRGTGLGERGTGLGAGGWGLVTGPLADARGY